MDNFSVIKPSILHIHSIGVAAINLPLQSKILEVTPLERIPLINNELTDNVTQITVGVTDYEGAKEEAKVSTTPTYQATWIPFSSNRFTPPNIRRGEKVLIWRKADADAYYWSEYEYDADLRKLETLIFVLSNTQDENAKADSTNTWYFELSTHTKMLHIRLNNSDGEPHAWDIQFNGKESTFLVTDDIQNTISMESQEKKIQLINTDGTTIILDKKNGHFYAPENMSFESGKNMSFKVGENMTHNVVGGWAWKTGQSVTGEMPNASYSSETTSFSGNVNVGKKLSTGGFYSSNSDSSGFKVNGRGTFEGTVNVNGNVDVTGNVSAANID